jgi:hypothetical protein
MGLLWFDGSVTVYKPFFYQLKHIKMRQIKAKFPKRESEFVTTSERVEEKMTNNPVFTNTPEALAELKKVRPEFQAARKNARSHDKELVAIKNNLKESMLKLLTELAEYVTVTCKGDRALILSSGFDVTTVNTGTTLPPAIEKLEVELGGSGEATTRIKNVKGIKAYIHQYTTESPGLNTAWIGEGYSEGTFTFEGLTSEKRHWFRVVAIGWNKQRSYSPIVSKVIQ